MQPPATEAKGLEERQSERAGSIHELMQEPAAGTVLCFS